MNGSDRRARPVVEHEVVITGLGNRKFKFGLILYFGTIQNLCAL